MYSKRMLALPCVLLMTLGLPAQQKPAAANTAVTENARILARAADLADSGKLDAARAEYERALRAGADIQRDRAHTRRLGLCYLNGSPQDLQRAVQWLAIAHYLAPADADTTLAYAQSLAWSGNTAQAIQQYSALHEKAPRNADYVIGLANLQFANEQADAALALLNRFTQDVPSDRNVRLLYGRFLGYSKQYVEAIGQYQAVLQNDPRNVDALIGIAKINSWQGDNNLALEQFEGILRTHPKNNDALVGKAYALLWLGRKTEAREIFAAVNERNPADKEIAATLRSLPAPPKPVAARVAPAAIPKPSPAVQASTAIAQQISPITVPEAPITLISQHDELTQLAQASMNAGNYAEAIHRYHEVLKLDPHDRAAALQIARLLSWSKSYGDSAAAYEELIAQDPHDTAVAAERARVLSWAKRFPESLEAYQSALASLPQCDSQPCPSEKSLRIEYARVLSWAGKYDEALAQYSAMQMAAAPTNDEEKTAMLDRARTLAWAKRYTESSAQFETVAQAGGDTFDARLGKAQVTYWSGDPRRAAVMLRQLSTERPKDPTVALTLAAVEHNLGYNARALTLLSVAEPGVEANSLRETIRKDMRPILRFRYGYEDDLESETNGLQTTIKALRYGSSIEFSIHPDVRMEVANIVTNTLTSNPLLGKHSPDNLALETIARLRFHPRPWMALTLGGGVGTTGGDVLGASGPRRQHGLFEVQPAFTIKKTRVDLAVTRRIAEYTPLAISDNVVQTRVSSAVSQDWKRFHGALEYWHGHYSVDSPELNKRTHFSADGNGGAMSVTGKAAKFEKFTADMGMRYESFGFDHAALDILQGIDSAGFFTPRLYQRYAGTAQFAYMPTTAWRVNLSGTFGPQRVFGFGELSPPPARWGTTGSVDLSATYTLRALSLTAGYGYFSTETSSFPGLNNGNYDSHAATLQVTYRF